MIKTAKARGIMTQEDLNEVLGKSLANHQLRALAEDGGNP